MRQSFMYGAIILFAANLLNRIIGFFYQIFMMRLLTPEGVGLFNMVYPIYVLVLVAATASIPVAISKLVAEETARNNLAEAYRIFRVALCYIMGLSIFFTLVLLICAPLLKNHVFPNPKVYYCFLSLVPGVIIVALCSAFRGFFQGLQRMTPTAVTQITEQSVRVVAGLSIAYLLLPHGVEFAAIGISLGVVLGELSGFLLMLFIYASKRPRPGFISPLAGFSSPADISFRIFGLAVPITVTRLVTTGVMSVDAILIPYRLQVAGLTINQATAAYGELVGIAMVLVLTPGIITFALATALIPAVSDAVALNNYALVRRRVSDSFRLTMLAGIPATVVLITFPEQLCALLFDYPQASEVLKACALGGPFLYVSQTTTGILQGMGRPEKPLKNLIISSFIKVIGVYYLTAIPSLGIVGSALALSFSYSISAFLNYRDLCIQTGLTAEILNWALKPLVSSFFMIFAALKIQSFLGSNEIYVLVSLFCSLPLYLAIMYVIGGIKNEDIKRVSGFIKK